MTLPNRCRRFAGLWTATLLVSTAVGATPAPCPTTFFVERFIPADCEACWREGRTPGARSIAIDWIVPSARGDDAPLAAAALPEAAARAAGIRPDATLERRHALASNGPRVHVEDGPILNGYMGVRLSARQRAGAALPSGAAGYIALVETVPAGEEGSLVERRLVRILAGPLTLDPRRKEVEHLLALRIAAGTRIDGLAVVGWIETPSRKILAVAAGSAACGPSE